jgi:DNA-binding response OmpR family regulator
MGRSRDERTKSEYLETIVNESERLARLVDNVLDFSKIEQGKKIYRLRPTRLEEVAGSAVRAMQFPLAQQGFQLHLAVQEDMPELQADPDAIQQAILNLLTNAMKYSGDAREIDLRLCARNGDAVIEVADHGLGLAPEEQKRIFEKFYQRPFAREPFDRGDGAGADAGGAYCQGPRRARGSGKRAGGRQHLLRRDSDQADSHGGAGMTTVLAIEDDPAILRGLSDNLRFEGYDVITATDGETGYNMQRERKPDLILLDLMLPRMSGFEFCRKLRGEGIQTPVLMLTARSEEADRVLGLDLGADDYVAKPFSVRELMARVRALLRRSQLGADGTDALPDELRFGATEIDFRSYEARRNGEPVEMTRKEFAILRYLASRAGEVVSRDDLLNQVWGYDSYPSSRTVDNHVAGLRAKLERDASLPEHIRTVHGVGYKFVL